MPSETKACQNCKQNFTIEPEDFQFYEKMKVPAPTFCPDCRLKRRLIFRNERILFRRKDNSDNKEILCGFPASVPFPIYNHDYWWSDAWDAIDYGVEYDFSKNFFEQFRELMTKVPWASRSVINLVNSDYSDQAGHLKNCYLCFNCDYLENSSYAVRANTSKDIFDSLQIAGSEMCYDSTLINKCFRSFYSVDCDGSVDVYFSKQCVGCTNIFGCVNLRKKNYCIWNKQYSKEEYFKKLEEFNLGSRASVDSVAEKAKSFWAEFPSKYYRGIRNVSSSGDMLSDTKNTRQSYWISEAQDMRYSQCLYLQSADCYDYSVWGDHASLIYESVTCGQQVNNLRFCFDCWPSCQNLEYCLTCHSSSNLFGCVGLKKKEYCILNKQYSKEDYFALREKIIKSMNDMPYIDSNKNVYKYGEFFPPEFSPFAYNETMLQDVFPFNKEQALAKGYVWRDPEAKEYQTTITADKLPDHIKDAGDSVLKELICCAVCKRAYRIIPNELSFYKHNNIPLPHKCPNCRQIERFKLINPPKFWSGTCKCEGESGNKSIYKNTTPHFHGPSPCPNKFETSYAPNGKEIIYCEQCYQSEVV